MKKVIFAPQNSIKEIIYLPSSKSISNRMLIMQALSGSGIEPGNLSDSDDTRVLRDALKQASGVIDIGHAGTAMRFLTAFLSTRDQRVVLTGSDRMKQRPVGALVDALRELGAGIKYLEREGCAPLEIGGGMKEGGSIVVDGGISSQFISALMMIGPVLEGGLHLSLSGDVVSATYIRMTLSLMQKGGIEATFNGREINIPQGTYNFGRYVVESDWSGASYWYQVAAMMPGSVITLPNLEKDSLQGDSVLASLFLQLGVQSLFDGNSLVLRSGGKVNRALYEYDFTGCPDLVQTCAVTLCALGVPFRFSGTRTLRVKETDRLAALQVELGKFGFKLDTDTGGDWILWKGNKGQPANHPEVETYHDHRMAMAFAPLAIPFGKIIVNDPMVVTKSYPGFWQDLEKAGFPVSTL
ncbi:MAG: 3-phosphoshikimate 1-carboxyvinyltransferase [Bacteroidales bacterium]